MKRKGINSKEVHWVKLLVTVWCKPINQKVKMMTVKVDDVTFEVREPSVSFEMVSFYATHVDGDKLHGNRKTFGSGISRILRHDDQGIDGYWYDLCKECLQPK
jgi:hypothetical protein